MASSLKDVHVEILIRMFGYDWCSGWNLDLVSGKSPGTGSDHPGRQMKIEGTERQGVPTFRGYEEKINLDKEIEKEQ